MLENGRQDVIRRVCFGKENRDPEPPVQGFTG